MTNVFTLDDLNNKLEKKYGPFVFQAGRQKYNLQQVVRLAKDQREQVKVLIDSLDRENKDEITEDQMKSILEEVIRIVVSDGKGDQVLDVLNNDLLSLTVLFEAWVEHTQAGEA